MSAANGITNTIAVGAVSSPWWMSYLVHMSDAAAIALPILGCAWLLIQIANFFWPRNDIKVEVQNTKGTVVVKAPEVTVPAETPVPPEVKS